MSGWRRAGLWAPVAVCMTAIWALSAQVSPPGAGWLPDKLAHALLYGVFGLLTLRATHGGLRPVRARAACAALVLALAWGVVDEWHQSFVAGRDASAGDVAADLAGAAASVGVFAALAAGRRRRAGDDRARAFRGPTAKL